MSSKVAHTLGKVVAANVRHWRVKRALDQKGLADRLAGVGWNVDRTAITKIESGDRKVSVDDLALLAVALNVPLTVLLIPIGGGDVTATPDGRSKTVNRWWWFEWMIGNEPLPGRGPDTFGGEWRSGAEPLWLYERVRRAQRETATRHDLGAEPAEWLDALRELVDAVADMEAAGLPAHDLIRPESRRAIEHHGITPRRHQHFEIGQEGER